MKQRLISLFLALFCIAAGAHADVVINEQNFPDDIFRDWLLWIDNDKDEKFSDEEIANITGMRIDGMGIETLQGIEYFTALKELFCSENQLKTLDLSKNTALEGLFCYDNQLTTLDVSNCTALESLYCVNNQLESLDVSNNTALAWLDCGNNQLTSLVVSNNTALQSLSCSNNQLTSLVVSNNTALTSLNFGGNQLTTLNVSNNTALTYLNCGRNQLTSINLSTNTALTTLECGMNQLTSLDLSKNMALTTLECGMNQLTSLDLSKNTALRNLRCYKNAICGEGMTTLVNSLPTIPAGEEGYMVVYFEESFAENTDPDGNKMTPTQLNVAKDKGWKVYMMSDYQEVEYICGASEDDGVAIDATNFPDENFRNWLSKQNYGRDGILTDAEIAGVEEIEVYNKNIADLTGIQYFTELKTLICNDNQLTTLDVSKNTALTSLYCAWNKINTLNVSKNTNLSTLDCSFNDLSTLNVLKNTALEFLSCSDNKLSTLNVSKNTALIKLDCGWNQLTTLNVSKNTALEYLYCHLNQLTALDVSKNTALSDLNCSINQLTALDVSKNMNLRSLAFYDNDISGESMTTLVNSLPTIPAGDNGDLFVYNESEGTSDRNRITSAQVKVATDKGWKVYNSDKVEYAGESSGEDGDIAIDAKNFPDENFRNWLLAQDYGADGKLTSAEIAGVTEINVYNKNIADLTGIAYFTNLIRLDCHWNQLTSLDVTNNTALTNLYCSGNQLTKLNVTKNTALLFLGCSGNQLTKLNVTKNTYLIDMNCSGNQLTSLDVSKNTALMNLECYNNAISGEGMKTLVNSLPTIPAGDHGGFVVYNESGGIYEHNRITTAQVKVATDKGWKVLNTNWVDYAGVPEANGDVNGDGLENIADVVMLSKAILKGSTDLKYDVNGDGQVNAKDIPALVNAIAGY